MPVLRRPEKIERLLLPERRAILAADTDVLVIGGGPAGLGAAIGAAQAGAKVILAERYGFLGGNATAALVMPLMSFFTQHPSPERPIVGKLLPNDHGEGEAVIAGALKSLLERLIAKGGAIQPSLETGFVVPFDPEIFKIVALELLDELGIQFLFHSFAYDIFGSKAPEGVVFASKTGPIVIKAKMFVDATGDGDIAAYAGAEYEMGRNEDQLVQPMTLMFRMVGFDHAAFEAYVAENPTQWRGVHGLWDLIQKASRAGELDLAREDILFFGTPYPEEVAVNSTRITRVLGTDIWDLSFAEWQSRRQMQQIVNFLQKYVPGFASAYAAQSGVQVGVRETRRIRGDYQLTAADLLSARKFDDVIARGTYPLDIHNPNGSGTTLKRIPAGEAYDIPLRSLLPKGLDNVIVAGRCISGTHEAHSSYRVMPISMATGQAAGVCAALAAESASDLRDIAVKNVQRELLRQGADLGNRVKVS
ncbi:MAG: FAD-dependent oxidoreductase [Oligoflexus sp.]